MPTQTQSYLVGTLADDTRLTVKNDGAPVPLAALRASAIGLAWDGTGFRAHHPNLPADHAHYLMDAGERATVLHLVGGRCHEMVPGTAYTFQHSDTIGWIVDGS